MGLMDMLSGLLGKKAPKTGNSILDSLLGMLLKGGALGGLAGLLSKFKSAGLGAKVDSWVGGGPNDPLTSDEVTSALGSNVVSEVASKAGVSADQAAGSLASMLPNLINKLTPTGQLPVGNLLTSLKNLDFGSLLGGLGK